jgi:hypothetical protein
MSDRIRSALRWAFAALALTSLARPAAATQKFGPLQIAGNLQSQNLVRHPDETTFEYIQNRNTLHLQLDYDWLQGGKAYNKYDIPFIENSHFLLKYRGSYDSVYDTTPGFVEKSDIHGRAYAGRDYFDYAHDVGILVKRKGQTQRLRLSYHDLGLSGLSHGDRENLRFENALREFYFDVKFRGLPLTVRAGRQQIVWGETDNFRMLDRANSLDLTWHLVQELPPPAFGWDEIRQPFWMMKFLYDLGDVWKISQSFLEWYWNPGDWKPYKADFQPRPWGVRFHNPLTNPVDGAFFGGPCGALSNVTIKDGLHRGEKGCTQLLDGTKFLKQGNYDRDPFDNSQIGVRYHGIAPFGLEFTLNYFYQRWSGDDGTPSAPLRGLPRNDKNNARAQELYAKGIFPAEQYNPYVHSVGLSANYSDEAFTQAVFRFETIYDVGIPFFDVAKSTVVDTPSLPGITKKNMWKGMIAFDRNTWIRSLNKKTTFFFTGQFFWHYLPSNPSCDAQTVAQMSPSDRAKAGSCLTGPLDLPSLVRTPKDAFRDKVRDWETLATLAMFTFYRGGSMIPTLGIAVDPMNHYTMEPFWSFDWVVRDDFVIDLAQRYFVTPDGHSQPIFDPWGFSSLENGRSETSLRLTFQF